MIIKLNLIVKNILPTFKINSWCSWFSTTHNQVFIIELIFIDKCLLCSEQNVMDVKSTEWQELTVCFDADSDNGWVECDRYGRFWVRCSQSHTQGLHVYKHHRYDGAQQCCLLGCSHTVHWLQGGWSMSIIDSFSLHAWWMQHPLGLKWDYNLAYQECIMSSTLKATGLSGMHCWIDL